MPISSPRKGNNNMKPPESQTKAQRDASLAHATKGPAPQVKGQNLQKVGSGRKGSKQGK